MLLIVFLLLFGNGLYNYEPTPELAKSIQKIYNPPRTDYIILIDYSKPISEERLYVMDMRNGKIILKSTVAHAYKSGRQYPISFSNQIGTKKSCIGAFQTLNSYYGKWGYSMRIDGLDPGINDNALTRAIVFHSNIVQKTTWSEGCFATPDNINKKLIDMTKNGCLIFVYR